MKPKEAYGSVEWDTDDYFWHAGARPSHELDRGQLLIAESLTDLVRTFAPVHLQAAFMLALLYLLTSVFTELLPTMRRSH